MIRISDASKGKIWKLKSNSLKSPTERSAHAPMEKSALKSIVAPRYGRTRLICSAEDKLHTADVLIPGVYCGRHSSGKARDQQTS